MPEAAFGIGAYAAYLPALALGTTAFRDAGGLVAGRPARSVANHDEDAVTMAVAAAAPLGSEAPSGPLLLATSEPPYLDKSAAATVHAALGLPAGTAAVDLAGLRSGAAALLLALRGGGLAVSADLRTAPPGAPDELAWGDAAAAFRMVTAAESVVRLTGSASTTIEILDRWRLPGARHPDVWDERFTADALGGIALTVARTALADAGVEAADHVVVATANARLAAPLRKGLGGGADAEIERVTGAPGAAHLGLLLADALDRAEPGDRILALAVADGADALVLEVGAGIVDARRGSPVRDQLASRTGLSYDRYLRIRRLLELRGARRPDPQAPAAPPSHRRAGWKFRLEGASCAACGETFSPPARVCPACGAVDRTAAVDLGGRHGTVVSFTVDRLAPSPDPPVVVAVVDLDGGGRLTVQMTDLPDGVVAVGDRVVPVFRRIHTSEGIHNYFWKARPVDA